MASGTVTYQPGLRSQKEYSGSVGGYDGPNTTDEDVFLSENQRANNDSEVPIPMGLEVFEKVSKLVAHQIVINDEGKVW